MVYGRPYGATVPKSETEAPVQVLPQVAAVNTVTPVADDRDLSTRLDGAADKLVVVDIGKPHSASRIRMVSVEADVAVRNQDVVFLYADADKCPENLRNMGVDEEETMTVVFLKKQGRTRQVQWRSRQRKARRVSRGVQIWRPGAHGGFERARIPPTVRE